MSGAGPARVASRSPRRSPSGLVGAVALPGERLGLGVFLVAVALAAVGAPFAMDRGCGRVRAGVRRGAALPRRAVGRAAVARRGGGARLARDRRRADVAGGRCAGWRSCRSTAPWGPSTVALAARAAGAATSRRAGSSRRCAASRSASGLVAVFGAAVRVGRRGVRAARRRHAADLVGPRLAARAPARLRRRRRGRRARSRRGPGAAGHRRCPRRGGASARTEWLVGLGALNALFAAFVAVQLAVLFGRHDHVLETAGLTYAEYAHQGFGQLLLVAALTLAVAAAALRYGPPGRRTAIRVAARRALRADVRRAGQRAAPPRALRGGLRRDALRFAAQWALLVVGALLGRRRRSRSAANRFALAPARDACVTGALALLVLAAANPDRRIAERNLDRAEVDAATCGTLSSDARPVLPPRLDPPAETGGRLGGLQLRPMRIVSWNVAGRRTRLPEQAEAVLARRARRRVPAGGHGELAARVARGARRGGLRPRRHAARRRPAAQAAPPRRPHRRPRAARAHRAARRPAVARARGRRRPAAASTLLNVHSPISPSPRPGEGPHPRGPVRLGARARPRDPRRRPQHARAATCPTAPS